PAAATPRPAPLPAAATPRPAAAAPARAEDLVLALSLATPAQSETASPAVRAVSRRAHRSRRPDALPEPSSRDASASLPSGGSVPGAESPFGELDAGLSELARAWASSVGVASAGSLSSSATRSVRLAPASSSRPIRQR